MTYGFVFVRPNAGFEACVLYNQTVFNYTNIGKVVLLNERFHRLETNRPAAEVDEVSEHLSNDESYCNVQQGLVPPPC